MKSPTRLVFLGDRFEAQRHTGRARKEMLILENSMSFQGLKQGARTVRPYPGVVIECWSCFSLRQANIYVEQVGGADDQPREWRECFCCTCFAIGKILNIYEETTSVCRYYDVEVCQGGLESYRYEIIEGVQAVDAGWYTEGQLVMLGCIPSEEVEHCCPDQPLDGYEMCGFAPTGLFPVILPIVLAVGSAYAMWEWRKKHVY